MILGFEFFLRFVFWRLCQQKSLLSMHSLRKRRIFVKIICSCFNKSSLERIREDFFKIMNILGSFKKYFLLAKLKCMFCFLHLCWAMSIRWWNFSVSWAHAWKIVNISLAYCTVRAAYAQFYFSAAQPTFKIVPHAQPHVFLLSLSLRML